MISPVTDRKLAEGLRRIRLAKAAGELPPGEVSLRVMADYCGLSPATIAAIERVAKAKLVAALLERHAADLSPRETSLLRQQLASSQP